MAVEHLSGSRQIVRPPPSPSASWQGSSCMLWRRVCSKEVGFRVLLSRGSWFLRSRLSLRLRAPPGQWRRWREGHLSKDCLAQRGASTMVNIRGSRRKCGSWNAPVAGALCRSWCSGALKAATSARDGAVSFFASASLQCRPARDSLGWASRCGSLISVSVPTPSSASHFHRAFCAEVRSSAIFVCTPSCCAVCPRSNDASFWGAFGAASPPLFIVFWLLLP